MSVKQQAQAASSRPHRCGYIALAGMPNVGKSALLNAFVGGHLSIVTPKAQTTRERVSGIVTTDEYQILFIDAPGLIDPSYALQETMRWAAGAAINEADVIAYVSDATRHDTLPGAELAEAIGSRTVPVVIALNKIDLVGDADRRDLCGDVSRIGYKALPISAATGEGTDALIEWLVPRLPESPALFPEEDSATQPVRFFVQEYVRETCMELFQDEVPYSIACRVDEFREEGEPVYMRVFIYVERESQKGIVVGKGGAAIRRVGERSRKKIEELIGARAFLELRVKVMPSWTRDRAKLGRFGYRAPMRPKGGH